MLIAGPSFDWTAASYSAGSTSPSPLASALFHPSSNSSFGEPSGRVPNTACASSSVMTPSPSASTTSNGGGGGGPSIHGSPKSKAPLPLQSK